jgi:UDP-perosamine 4-acetyltransferase
VTTGGSSLQDRPVVLLGAGGHARVMAEALALADRHLAGHVATAAAADSRIGNYLGNDNILPELVMTCDFAIGFGFVDACGARRRAGLLARLRDIGATLACITHPNALISPSALMASGTFVAMGAMVGTGARVGRGSIVNTGAIIDHDSQLGENGHMGTGARLAGGVTCGDDVLIGAGAVVRQGLTVGAGAIVGAGAVVIRNVAAGDTVVGNPARPILQT